MDFNRVIYLATIHRAGGFILLSQLWNTLKDICLIVPDFKLKQSNFYTIIGSLENQGMIISKKERIDIHVFESKSVSITENGEKLLQSYYSLFLRLLPS